VREAASRKYCRQTGETDGKNQGVDSREKVKHIEKTDLLFVVSIIDERARVTTDEERVFQGCLQIVLRYNITSAPTQVFSPIKMSSRIDGQDNVDRTEQTKNKHAMTDNISQCLT